MITVGVEEEFFLVDPVTCLPLPLADEVRRTAGLGPIAEDEEVQSELLQSQIEVATPVCSDLGEVGGHLLRLRHALGAAAEKNGCRLVAAGTAPYRGPAPVPVTRSARYLAMRSQAPQLVDEQLINGMHVHVAVPGRSAAVAVLNRIRPWLPVLVAMASNSPLWDGHDTGFASWRTVIFGRWAVSGPPPPFAGAADHDRRVRTLLDSGVITDTGQLYWQARLSERYPTVEVRCTDVQLRADAAVMFAGLIRALVVTALHAEEAGEPLPHCPPELLQAANWYAARHGLSDLLVDPEGRSRRAGDVLCRLLDSVAPALEETGDTREVTSLVHRLLRQGTPADLQRRALAEGGMPALADLLTTETVAP
ncbi:glutamate--cysteine ligase [Streptomyces somaliensis DSM 40738]|uniref:Putative glutamate--cysteine ligase 2 n=1 Tax=Streptomyces somaliensis (strain ATCC 33201 / DSM 40738 / JCM 12659 / KCTC 9044 / NCTC 11332 / NRRL B-12077 / IP 733) TaxID=1134445 RepID=A0AA44DFP4_STRE0|nr:glutamate--cysteine ligase [Streptomyces somaliensis]MCQ0021607.1 glutamate--cysteine ligase [Streptomyces somaliensis DSM 40738]NKY16033.1 glutamate--cysteine ligase [Streptomyces somaliensis DSM 40738]